MEAIPLNGPLSRRKEVDLHMFVEGNYTSNKQHRRSRTGYMICMSMSFINWYSKKQSTKNTSVFDTEFVSMKV